MIESPQTSVQLFESIHEHPELIWNDKTRDNVGNAVNDMCESFYRAQKLNAKHMWKDPEILKDIISNEIVVAGVYLRLFVANPAWTLRKPKQFLSDLLDFVVDQISKSSSEVKIHLVLVWRICNIFFLIFTEGCTGSLNDCFSRTFTFPAKFG